MMLSIGTLRRFAVSSAVATTIAMSPLFSGIAEAQTLSGAGATFPAPLYERYFSQFRRETRIQVNYQAIGSGGGIRQVIAGTVDFGASDAAMTDAQINQVRRGVIMVPTAGGAVSVVYNLPGVGSLRLSRSVLPDIFSGRIRNWNDQRIRNDNPGVNLPNLPIRVVVRADSSGTTFIFTNHLSAINPYFRGRIGASTSPRWTVGQIQGRGNPGVAAQVGRTPGAIGYVEDSFARSNNLKTAQVQNRAGQYMDASVQSAEDALETVTFPENFRVFVSDPARGYPIVGMTWLLVYRRYDNQQDADAVKRLVRWILTTGQGINNSLQYVRVPSSVAQRAIRAVETGVTVGR
jgi:phosphate transport system substrate-binding protein